MKRRKLSPKEFLEEMIKNNCVVGYPTPDSKEKICFSGYEFGSGYFLSGRNRYTGKFNVSEECWVDIEYEPIKPNERPNIEVGEVLILNDNNENNSEVLVVKIAKGKDGNYTTYLGTHCAYRNAELFAHCKKLNGTPIGKINYTE